MQEEYIKEEQRNLKKELLRAEEEVKRIQSVPLFIGQFLEMVDANSGVVSSTTGVSLLLVLCAHPAGSPAPAPECHISAPMTPCACHWPSYAAIYPL